MLTMICLVVGTVLCFVIGGFCLNDYQHKWADLAAAVSTIIGIVGIIAVIGTTIAIIVVHVNPEGQLAAYQSEKAMLEYRLDQKEYLNDNNIGMTELMPLVLTAAPGNSGVLAALFSISPPRT